MNCDVCGKTMSDGVYVCRDSDYRIEDSDNNLVFIIQTHPISSDDSEINDSLNVKYCVCGHWKI